MAMQGWNALDWTLYKMESTTNNTPVVKITLHLSTAQKISCLEICQLVASDRIEQTGGQMNDTRNTWQNWS